jgi:hypothetical protein
LTATAIQTRAAIVSITDMRVLQFRSVPLVGILAVLGVSHATLAHAAVPAVTSIEHMDDLYARRGQPGAIDALIAAGHSILQAEPDRYDAAWRLARALSWRAYAAAGRPAKRAIAATAMQHAETAVALNPTGVEGHFMLAIAVGVYGSSVGVAEALVRGIAPKFERAARTAYDLDKHFEDGSPIVALGRYHYELPWPLRDLERSAAYLEEAKRLHPTSLRGRLYLAETYYEIGKSQQAHAELAAVAAADPTDPDAAEIIATARADLARWFGAPLLVSAR